MKTTSLLFALLATTLVVADESVPNLTCLGGSVITRGDLGFAYHGPTIVTDERDPKSPSYALATVKIRNEKRRLLFLMIFDYGGKQISGAGWITGPSMEGHEIKDSSTAIIDDTKKISFAFGYDANDTSSESFSINGKAIDKNSPRVFLVDLTTKTPKLTPLNAKLPKAVPDFHSRDASQTGKQWRVMIDELKQSSPEIKKFINGYGKE